jgi:hypothetical protein
MMALAMEQLAQDQAPPLTDYSATDLPGRTVYSRRPFEAMTGRRNITPYGTISSRPENEEERVAREWHEKVVRPQQEGTINGQPASSFRGESVPYEPPAEEEGYYVSEPMSPTEAAEAQKTRLMAQRDRLSRAFANPDAVDITGRKYSDDPAYQEWLAAENARRAENGLGPVETAFEDFVSDREVAQQEDVVARQLESAARRAERDARIASGRRTRTGEMVPTRSSSITPSYTPILRENARKLAKQILRGGNPDDITKGWQNLVRGAIAGATVPMSREEFYNQQQFEDQRERMNLSRQANRRAEIEFQQEQEARKRIQQGLMEFIGAKNDTERRQILEKYPEILNTQAGRAAVEGASDRVSRVDYGTYTQRLRELNRKVENGIPLTEEEEYEVQFLNAAIAKFTQDEAKRQGLDTRKKGEARTAPPQSFFPKPSTKTGP